MEELGKGHEGIVYRDGDHAKKIFYSDRKLSKRTTAIGKILSRLQFKTFMRPFNFVINKKGLLDSYEMEILPENDGDKFTLMRKKTLVKALRDLREDVLLMADYNIKTNDLQSHNIRVFHDSIRFYDFSLFRFAQDKEQAKTYNNEQLNNMFGSIAVQEENPDINPIDIYDKFYARYLRSGHDRIEDFIEEEMDTETIRQYIKK